MLLMQQQRMEDERQRGDRHATFLRRRRKAASSAAAGGRLAERARRRGAGSDGRDDSAHRAGGRERESGAEWEVEEGTDSGSDAPVEATASHKRRASGGSAASLGAVDAESEGAAVDEEDEEDFAVKYGHMAAARRRALLDTSIRASAHGRFVL